MILMLFCLVFFFLDDTNFDAPDALFNKLCLCSDAQAEKVGKSENLLKL
jgi:hypothetical protein